LKWVKFQLTENPSVLSVMTHAQEANIMTAHNQYIVVVRITIKRSDATWLDTSLSLESSSREVMMS